MSPFLYYINHWWPFFIFFFTLYLVVFTISAYKNFMHWW